MSRYYAFGGILVFACFHTHGLFLSLCGMYISIPPPPASPSPFSLLVSVDQQPVCTDCAVVSADAEGG